MASSAQLQASERSRADSSSAISTSKTCSWVPTSSVRCSAYRSRSTESRPCSRWSWSPALPPASASSPPIHTGIRRCKNMCLPTSSAASPASITSAHTWSVRSRPSSPRLRSIASAQASSLSSAERSHSSTGRSRWRSSVQTATELLGHWLERPPAEDRLDRQREIFGIAQGELEAWVVLAPLQVSDRLVADVEGICQLLAQQAALRPQNGQPVEQRRLGTLLSLRHHASAGGSGSTHASAV